MEVLEEMPIDHVKKFNIDKCKIVVIDANIGPSSMKDILMLTSTVPDVILEPISTEKLQRVIEADLIKSFTSIKLNMNNLHVILYGEIKSDSTLQQDITESIAFLKKISKVEGNRLDTLIITRGSSGVSYIQLNDEILTETHKDIPV